MNAPKVTSFPWLPLSPCTGMPNRREGQTRYIRKYYPPPLPCPVTKYRGAVQRTEGLNIQTKILSYFFTSTPKKRWFLRSFPVVPDAAPYPWFSAHNPLIIYNIYIFWKWICCILFIIYNIYIWTSRFSVDELWVISVLFDLFFEKSKIHYKF